MKIRIGYLLAAATLFLGGLLVPAPPAQAADWTTVWRDDFDTAAGTLPSSSDWRFDLGTGFGTGEIERTTNDPANVSTDGRGNLAITPLRDAAGNWTSARIESNRDDFQPPAGGALRLEARIQLPAVTGPAAAGYWPAFWSLGTPLRTGGSWPDVGEFDVLEDVNGQNLAYGTLHCGVNDGGPCHEHNGLGGNTTCPGSPCPGNFHTYTFEWDRGASPETLRWYVDGQQYWSVSAAQVDPTTWAHATQHGIFVIFDLAMGGDFPNGVAGFATPTAATEPGHPMLIDYVQVQTTGSSPPPPAAGGPIVGYVGKCIDVPGGNGVDGQPLQLYDCNSTPAQRWTFETDGTIRAYGLCMDDAGASLTNGTNVQLARCSGNRAQQFVLNEAHDLVNQLSGKCVDVRDFNTANGAGIQQWDCAGTPNQKWSRG